MPDPNKPDLFRQPEWLVSAPRGDLIERVQTLVEENLRPLGIMIEDPVSGVVAPAIITPEGVKAIPASIFDDYLDGPRSRTGKAVMTSLDSFIDHVNRFKDEHTAVFACDSHQSPSLTAVLDYSPGGATSDEIGNPLNRPRHGRHRTTFAFPLSEEWKAWRDIDGQNMNLVTFARFIEDRITDVMVPELSELTDAQMDMVRKLGGPDRLASPQSLFELSRGLAVRENANIKEARNLSSGEGEIVFTEEHTDFEGRPLTVPTTFLLGIPVFHNGPLYQILARLRYNVKGGLTFKVELWREDRVFDHAFGEAVERVKDETGAEVFIGAPEA